MIVQPNPSSITSFEAGASFLSIPTQAMTLAGFRRWARSGEVPQHAHLTFVQQQILVDMTNEGLDCHVKVKTAVAAALFPLVRKMDLGEFFTDGVLITNVAAGVSNNPDSSFVSWASYDGGRVRRLSSTGDQVANDEEAHELEGSPDWVLEIVSRNSVVKDTRLLPAAYHASNIPEFWLIDARAEVPRFDINVRGGSEYQLAERVGAWQKSTLFDRWFRLVRETTKRGFLQFELQITELPEE